MLLVTQTDTLAKRFGIEKAIELIADAGFDALDYSMFEMHDDNFVVNGQGYLDYAKKLKAKAQSCGIKFVQAHAPFEYSHDATDKQVEKMTKKVIRAIEFAALLGVEIIVVHPLQHMNYTVNVEKLFELNMEYYKRLAQYGERFGIKIAVENMFQFDGRRGVIKDSTCASPQEFCKYIDTVNSPYVVGCLDIGHCGLCGRDCQYVLRYMGADRIKCLHIHDNDYKNDRHAIPFTGDLNWDEICKALAQIGYSGNFTYECDKFLTRYDDEFIITALKFMHDTGRHLIKKINSYKKVY